MNNKDYLGDSVCAEFDGFSITLTNDVQYRIYASKDALPGTCKLVEKEVVIPAQPERVEKRMVLECNNLAED